MYGYAYEIICVCKHEYLSESLFQALPEQRETLTSQPKFLCKFTSLRVKHNDIKRNTLHYNQCLLIRNNVVHISFNYFLGL